MQTSYIGKNESVYQILLEIQLAGANLFTHIHGTQGFMRLCILGITPILVQQQLSSIIICWVTFQDLLKTGILTTSYQHFLSKKSNIFYSKLTKILVFVSFCFSALQLFWRETMSKLTSFTVTKACQGCSLCSAAAVNPLV